MPDAPAPTPARSTTLTKAPLSQVDQALRQTERLAALVDLLLDVSRLDKGELTLNREIFDLRQAAGEAVERFRPAAEQQGSRLERRDKAGIPCDHLFTGSGDAATEVLLFFPRGADPIQPADKSVTLESRFAPFQLSVKFALKDMMYKGELAL